MVNNMRLIDADALQNLLIPVATGLEKQYGCLGGAVSGVMQHIDAQPTIDAVPVVRCKYCNHHHWEQEPCHGKTVHYCKKLKIEVWGEFFCAYGDWKDGEG